MSKKSRERREKRMMQITGERSSISMKHPRRFDLLEAPNKDKFVVFDTRAVSDLFHNLHQGKDSYELTIAPLNPPYANVFMENEAICSTVVFEGRLLTIQICTIIGTRASKIRVIPVAEAQFLLDDQGFYLEQVNSRISAVPVGFPESDFRHIAQASIAEVIFVLHFMNCRNVELQDVIPTPADVAAHEHKFGVPMTKYKVLRVNPIGKRYEGDDKPQQQFDIMPLHIRRGHFKRYTEDAPLFGKYTGTFWCPATAVGNEKNGVRVKDYKLGQPNDTP